MQLNKQNTIHPLFGLTLAFIFGILGQYFQLHFFFVMLTIGFVAYSIYTCFSKKLDKKYFYHCLLIICISLGFIRFFLWQINNNQIIEMLKIQRNYIAQILDINDNSDRFFKHKILLKLTPLDHSKKFNIYVYAPNLSDARICDRFELHDFKINSIKDNYESLYSSESIIPKIFMSNLKFHNKSTSKFSLVRLLKETKYILAKKLTSKMSKVTAILFQYIFLGLKDTSNLSNQLRYKFNYWGIAHYLARSGLHVIMIIFLWSILLKLLPVNFILKQLILIILSIIYTILSWPTTSFERSFVTFLFVQLCLILKLPIRSSYLIILCTLLFLIINPAQLFFLDFQLSFGLAIGISLFNELQN